MDVYDLNSIDMFMLTTCIKHCGQYFLSWSWVPVLSDVVEDLTILSLHLNQYLSGHLVFYQSTHGRSTLFDKLVVNPSWICIRNTTLYVEYMYCYLNILYRTSYLTFINQDSQLQLFDIQFESAHLYIPLVLLSCEFYTQCTSGYSKLSVRYSFSCSKSCIKVSNPENL